MTAENPSVAKWRPDWHLFGMLALLLAVVATRAHSYLLFHTLAELFLVVVSLTAFALAWNVRRHLDNPVLLMAGMALAPVAVLAILHALAFKGMGIFPADANLATQLWVAERGLDGAAMMIAALLGARRVAPHVSLGAYSAAALALGVLVFTGLFPDCFVAGQGLTAFKIGAEYAIMAAFAVATLRLWQLRQMFPPPLLRLLVGANLLSLAEEACFTLYVDVYGALNMAGHLVAVVVGLLLYTGLVRYGLSHPQLALYGRLNDAALRDNERAALALETLDGGIWEWDTVAPLRPLSARHAGWLQLPPDPPLTVAGWRERIVPEDRAVWDALTAARPPGPAVFGEYRLRLPDGGVRWFSGSSRVFTTGAGLRMIGLDRDVSIRKASEIERQRLSEDVRKFSEILAHHLQEPARLQACYAQVLRRQLPDPCPSELAGAINVIEDGANYLRRLLRDAHLYIVLDRLPPPEHPVDCAGAVAEAWKGLAAKAEACGARLETASLPMVRMAPARLVDLFGILLGNALEYRSPDRAPVISVTSQAGDGELVLSVADNGIGIQPRYHEQIFRPFERLHTQSQHPGTGIGLALARKIVDSAGGRIWVESETGTGATFHIALPHGDKA
ncbi:MAG: MASE3 domain-containing protein [Bacteroidales bacterium]